MRFCPRIYERENFSIIRRLKMVANKEKLRLYLEAEHLTDQEFAMRLGVEQNEADKLLAGERVGYDTARKFIYYLNGVIAQHYIDWDATESDNPLAEESEDSYTEGENETKGEDEV